MNEIEVNMENLNEEERKQLLSLIEKANKTNKKYWKPRNGEEYFSIGICDNVLHQVWKEDCFDRSSFEIGNVFKTKDEAEEEIKRRKILAKWKQLSVESGEEDNPWDSNNGHHLVSFNVKEKLLRRSEVYNIHYCGIYFKTAKSLEDAIKEIGEENVKKYILGVKE